MRAVETNHCFGIFSSLVVVSEQAGVHAHSAHVRALRTGNRIDLALTLSTFAADIRAKELAAAPPEENFGSLYNRDDDI